jgi:hypothetical protein
MALTLGAVIKGGPYSNKMYHCFVKLWSPVFITKRRTQIEIISDLIISWTDLIMLYKTINTINKPNRDKIGERNNGQDKCSVSSVAAENDDIFVTQKPASARRSHNSCDTQDRDERHTLLWCKKLLCFCN